MTIFGYQNGKQYMNMKLLYIYIEQSKINYEIKQLISLHHEKQLKRMKIFNNEDISKTIWIFEYDWIFQSRKNEDEIAFYFYTIYCYTFCLSYNKKKSK